jgi:hypothetical protein
MTISQATKVAKSQVVLPEALAKNVNGNWIFGSMETDLDPNSFQGLIVARMGETNPDPGAGNQSIIDSSEPWQVEVYWLLFGSLNPFICGKWCARLYLETLGKSDIDLELNCDQGLIDFTPNVSGYSLYYASFTAQGDVVQPEHAGTPFQPVVTVTSLTSYMRGPGLDPNDDQSYFTGPMTGFVPFPITEFLKEEVEP